MIRGALVGLIHHRSLNVQSGTHDDGNAVTLMHTDVDSIDGVGQMFHETWAQLLEVIVGIALLTREIGWFSPVPLFIIICKNSDTFATKDKADMPIVCFQLSRYVAKHLQSKQKAWSVATQKRLAMITYMLGSAKSMKMLGLTEAVRSNIRDLRDHEIEMSKRLRWMIVAYNASGKFFSGVNFHRFSRHIANALGIFSPVVTLVLFAIFSNRMGGHGLDADTVFTSVALLAMVTHPANMIMTIIPRAVASLANSSVFNITLLNLLGKTKGLISKRN